jgi:hypothetical protein
MKCAMPLIEANSEPAELPAELLGKRAARTSQNVAALSDLSPAGYFLPGAPMGGAVIRQSWMPVTRMLPCLDLYLRLR